MPQNQKTSVNNLIVVWQGSSWSVIAPDGQVLFRHYSKQTAYEWASQTDDYASDKYKPYEFPEKKKRQRNTRQNEAFSNLGFADFRSNFDFPSWFSVFEPRRFLITVGAIAFTGRALMLGFERNYMGLFLLSVLGAFVLGSVLLVRAIHDEMGKLAAFAATSAIVCVSGVIAGFLGFGTIAWQVAWYTFLLTVIVIIILFFRMIREEFGLIATVFCGMVGGAIVFCIMNIFL